MGQYYKMLNIDKRETLEFSSSKFWDVLSRDDPIRLIRMLAIPRKLEPYEPVNKRGLSTDTRDLGALDLPYDVLHHIFSKIYSKDIKDAVYLALTNSLLRDLGQKRVNEELVSGEYHAPWYAERLILVGENVDGDDLPADMLLEDEKEELAGNAIVDDDPLRSCLYNADRFYYDDRRLPLLWSDKFYNAPGLSSAEREEMELLVEEDFYWDGNPATEWILYNWTTSEYVRVSGVAALSGSQCRGPWTKKFPTLGHVLLTQICWAGDDSGSMFSEYAGGYVPRGRWAGHRFLITTVDRLKDSDLIVDRETWDDATHKVINEVMDIWRHVLPRRILVKLPASKHTVK